MHKFLRYIKQNDWPWLLVGLGTTLAIGITTITRSSVWHDESFSSILSRLSPWEIVATTANDVHPPLYYLALNLWMSLFGSSDAAIRSLSLVCLVGALAGVYYLLRRYVGHAAARWGLLVGALGPFTLRYGIEARMYTFGALLMVAATWLLLLYMEKRRRTLAVGYGLSIAALLYTHYFTFPIVIIHGLFLYWHRHGGLFPRWSRIKELSANTWWLKSLGLAGAIFLPWLPVAIRQFRDVQGGFWVSKERLLDPFETLIFYQSNIASWKLETWQLWLYAATLILIAVAIYSVWWRSFKTRQLLWILFGTGLLPLIIILAASYALPSSSVYVDRYFSFYAIFWYTGLGLLLWLLRDRRWLQLLLAVVLAAQFAFGIYNLYHLGNFNWERVMIHDMRETMEVVNHAYLSGDQILAMDLYVYFDAAHYNQTAATVQMIDPGYSRGNASLVSSRDEVKIDSLDEFEPGSRVWLLTLKSQQPELPSNWQPVSDRYEFEVGAVQRFEVMPTSVEEFSHIYPSRIDREVLVERYNLRVYNERSQLIERYRETL